MSKIVFITDVEGNIDYLRSVCSLCPEAITLKETKTELSFELKDDFMLVFGGDVTDKGLGSIRVLRALAAAYDRYGMDRVVLIAGNRDINKIRFSEELSDEALRAVLTCPSFVPERARVDSLAYAPKSMREALGVGADHPLDQAELERFHASRAGRLRWILDNTMGSVGEFENRRKELSEMEGRPAAEVTDDHVVDSFLASIRPGGAVLEYLSRARLAARVGDVLFVHGGLFNPTEFEGDCVGLVPLRDGPRVADLGAWIVALNAWFHDELGRWRAAPHVLPFTGPPDEMLKGRSAAKLLEYCASAMYGPTTIMARHLDKKSQLVPMPAETLEKLTSAGLSMLVLGHTPHGTCPSPLREGPGDHTSPFITLLADTSYSQMGVPGNRGPAATAVIITPAAKPGAKAVAAVKGRLPDLTPLSYTVTADPKVDGADPRIGRRLPGPDGWWVKAKLDSNGNYYLSQVNGYTYSYKEMSPQELDAALAN